jgi:hypothetical protein
VANGGTHREERIAMTHTRLLLAAFAVVAFAGCAAPPPSAPALTAAAPAAPAAAKPVPVTDQPYGPATVVKSRDGKSTGEVIGTPEPGSKFSKLQIGMTMDEVSALIGGPDTFNRHETGKRWIPFYFGNDVQRYEVLYKSEGCLTYTAGNQFGGGSNELIRITVTKRLDCID